MTKENIKVVYKQLGNMPGTGVPYYHETLVYTNSSGQQFIASCYNTGSDPVGSGNLLSALGNAASGKQTSWKTLGCTTGAINASNVINTWGQQGVQSLIDSNNPSTTVVTGTDLSKQWAKITQAEQEITNQNFSYSPLTLNSNSAANTALTAAGITPPQDNGISGPHWAPAAGNILSTTMTKAVSSESITQSTDLAGNAIYTITNKDSNGNVTDATQINAAAQTVNVKAFNAGNLQWDQTTTTNSVVSIDLRNFSALGTVTSEQLAAFDPTKNLTQVSNFSNGAVSGSGIIEGQATSAQLNQEAQLASQLSGSTMLADATGAINGALGIQSDANASAAIKSADGSLAAITASVPTFATAKDFASWISAFTNDANWRMAA